VKSRQIKRSQEEDKKQDKRGDALGSWALATWEGPKMGNEQPENYEAKTKTTIERETRQEGNMALSKTVTGE
jgi:hypothetical protein